MTKPRAKPTNATWVRASCPCGEAETAEQHQTCREWGCKKAAVWRSLGPHTVICPSSGPSGTSRAGAGVLCSQVNPLHQGLKVSVLPAERPDHWQRTAPVVGEAIHAPPGRDGAPQRQTRTCRSNTNTGRRPASMPTSPSPGTASSAACAASRIHFPHYGIALPLAGKALDSHSARLIPRRVEEVRWPPPKSQKRLSLMCLPLDSARLKKTDRKHSHTT